MYKLYLISIKRYKNANVDFLVIKTTSEIWISMKDIGSGMGVKNIFDLVLYIRNIWYLWKTKFLQKSKLMNIKWQKEKFIKKFTNLSKEELNTKNNKNPYVINDVMTTIIKRCRRENTRGIEAIDGFRKKRMIPDSEILKFQNLKLNKKSLKNVIPLKNILLRFMKLFFIFINIIKKVQADKNGCKYILFRIDVYFSEYF